MTASQYGANHPDLITALAVRYKLPAVYPLILDQFGLPEVLVAVSTPGLSCQDSSGESRLNRQNVLQRLNQQTGIVSDVSVLLNVQEQPRSTRGVHPTRLGRTVRETPLRVRGTA